MSTTVEQQQETEKPLDDKTLFVKDADQDQSLDTTSTEQCITKEDTEQSINQQIDRAEKVPDEDSVTTQVEDDLRDIAPFTKDDQHHPVLVLASSLANLEKTKVVVPPSPNLDIPARPDPAKATANLIVINKPNLKTIRPNTLGPKEQEKEAEPVLRGLRHLLNNRFMSAKTLFESNADNDPLFALALSTMGFLKAVMTASDQDQTMALNALNDTYDLAKAQLDAAKKPSLIGGYISSYISKTTGETKPVPRPSDISSAHSHYLPNGVMRAHVIEAECCLQIAIIQLLQESIMSYVKSGLNLRRAYSSYNIVWQEYKKMGSDHRKYMDRDTVSGVQFGIGAVHLVLSALPAKVLKAVSIFGWKPDKKLGFELLKECASSKRVRSSMATMMLLAYYSAATSIAPQLLSEIYTKAAMETLLEAQKYYPNSAFYLFFAGHISRLASDLALSTQSYLYATDICKNEWAEVAVSNSCRFEIATNHMITGNWEQAAKEFAFLTEQNYWSPAFCKYAQGACLEMMGRRTEAILAFADVASLVVVHKLKSRMTDIDVYVQRKVLAFQHSGYQDLDFYLPALEFMCIWNQFSFISRDLLQRHLATVENALTALQAREDEEHRIRMQEIAPDAPLPDHYDQRAVLMLMRASIQNDLGDHNNITIHLNWIIDHKQNITQDAWAVPYALWEAGVSCWFLDRRQRSRHLWDMALGYSKYDFEHRLAVRLNLALGRCDDLGILKPEAPPGLAKKRFSLSLPSLTS
ncbi:hypothetical protein BC941DRAFT_445822 [Chlamydoabsidia padenii]|nr:hypothetical protein BC941DRAFT_445822 [Chlamydoabsidia padenii]